MTRQDAVLIADAAGLSIFALGRDREKFLLALEIFTTMVAAAERERLAKVFDERDKDIGWYDPGEPAEIIRGQA